MEQTNRKSKPESSGKRSDVSEATAEDLECHEEGGLERSAVSAARSRRTDGGSPDGAIIVLAHPAAPTMPAAAVEGGPADKVEARAALAGEVSAAFATGAEAPMPPLAAPGSDGADAPSGNRRDGAGCEAGARVPAAAAPASDIAAAGAVYRDGQGNVPDGAAAQELQSGGEAVDGGTGDDFGVDLEFSWTRLRVTKLMKQFDPTITQRLDLLRIERNWATKMRLYHRERQRFAVNQSTRVKVQRTEQSLREVYNEAQEMFDDVENRRRAATARCIDDEAGAAVQLRGDMEKWMKVWEKRDRQAKKARKEYTASLGALVPVLGGIKLKADGLHEREGGSIGDGASGECESAAVEAEDRPRKRDRCMEPVEQDEDDDCEAEEDF